MGTSPRRGRPQGGIAQQQRQPRRNPSRPWDNLAHGTGWKPTLRVGGGGGDGDAQRQVPRHVDHGGHAVAGPNNINNNRLPHERFTPLLRTAFGGGAPSGREEPAERESKCSGRKDDTVETEHAERYHDDDTHAESANRQQASRAVGHEISRLDHAEPATRDGGTLHNPEKVRLGHRSIKPLNVRALPPTPLAGLLPIPNLPPTPARTTYRHSIRSGPALARSSVDSDSDCDDDHDRPAYDSEGRPLRAGNVHDHQKRWDAGGGYGNDEDDDDRTFDNSSNGSYSDLKYKDHGQEPHRVPMTSIDTPQTPTYGLDGFRHSVRMSRRHSSVRIDAGGPSFDGLAVEHNSDDQYDNQRRPDPSPPPSPLSQVSDRGYTCLDDFVDASNNTSKSTAGRERVNNETRHHFAPVAMEHRSVDYSDADSRSTFASESSSLSDNDLEIPHPQQRSTEPVTTRTTPSTTTEGQDPGSNRYRVSRSTSIASFGDRSNVAIARRPSAENADIFDVPASMAEFADIEPAIRDLQRTSAKVGNELAALAFGSATGHREVGSQAERVSRAQGELLLRSRYLRRWSSRFASVIDHAFFGAVLFLFCMDAKAAKPGRLVLKNSKMIVLADTHVQEVDVPRKSNVTYLIELKTAQRTYMFACANKRQRKYWVKNFTMSMT